MNKKSKLLTKLFGKKIEGDALKNLVVAMGKNPEKVLNYFWGERWTNFPTKGKVRFSPKNQGVKVELYLLKQASHYRDGSIGMDNNPFETLFGQDIFYQSHSDYVEGQINYDSKENN